ITPNAGTAALCSYRQWSLRNAISRAWKVSRKTGAIQSCVNFLISTETFMKLRWLGKFHFCQN
ncbi:hypothetical protein ACIPK7_29600, partial [Pseudomonas sp. NPDC086581]|uniref:hypothetical protein n=1 Tax=Pseudomonas sp. NPDC086581 TaxID=3364432 RepID=UPI00380E2B19